MARLKIMFALAMLIFFLALASAEQIDTDISIKVSCANSTYANISYARYVLNSNYLFQEERVMTKSGVSYNYTIPASLNTQTGTLEYAYHCDVNGQDTVSGNQIFISLMGEELTTSQGIVYIILMIGMCLVLIFTIYAAWIFPWQNPRDVEGKVITINDLKYLKIFFWVLAYLEFIFIILILRNITGYLLIDGTYSFFNFVYYFLLVLLLPFFPVLIFFTIVTWLYDKKTLKQIERGLPIR